MAFAQSSLEAASQALDRADLEGAARELEDFFEADGASLRDLAEALRLRALVAFAVQDDAGLERYLSYLRSVAPDASLGAVPPPFRSVWEETEARVPVDVSSTGTELRLAIEPGFEPLVRGWRIRSRDGASRDFPSEFEVYPLQPGESARVFAVLLGGAELATSCDPCVRSPPSAENEPDLTASNEEPTGHRRRRRLLGGVLGAILGGVLAVAIAVPLARRDDGRTLNSPALVFP